MPTEAFLNEACTLVGDLGWSFYFVPTTAARAEALDLDVFSFYAIGRGGVLGDVEPPVVVSAFGYFKPSIVEFLWNEGRSKVPPREAARQHLSAAHDFARATFGGIEGLDRYCAAAEKVVRAAQGSLAAMALFAGYAAEPLPDDAPAKALQLTATLREFRGSAHLVALVANGVDPKVAHYLRRPEMFSTFGWTDAEAPETSDADIEALAAADELTDRLVAPAYDVLSSAEQDDFLAGLRAMEAAIDAPIGVSEVA